MLRPRNTCMRCDCDGIIMSKKLLGRRPRAGNCGENMVAVAAIINKSSSCSMGDDDTAGVHNASVTEEGNPPVSACCCGRGEKLRIYYARAHRVTLVKKVECRR